MNKFNTRRQTERVGIYPTLSAMVAGGIALEKVCNQHPSNIGKDYANYESNPLVQFSFYHVMTHHLRGAGLPTLSEEADLLPNFTIGAVNQRRGEPRKFPGA